MVSSLFVVLVTLLAAQTSHAVKQLDFIDTDETKLVLVLASQRAGTNDALPLNSSRPDEPAHCVSVIRSRQRGVRV